MKQLNNVPGGSGWSASIGGRSGGGECGGATGASDCGGAARPADCGGAAGPELAKRRLAVNLAAWSTIPGSAYCVCALKSLPLEQTKSSGTHKSMVLAAYSGPTS